MKTEKIDIKKVKPNADNPRVIKNDKYNKLVTSIKEFPEMLKLRPIVVNKDMIVLGGNMRLKACKEAKLKEVYIIKADELTEEQQKEFMIKDNASFGEWDWDIIANEWSSVDLEAWGIDVWQNVDDMIDKIYDIEEVETFSEKVNFIITCKNIEELEELQQKLDYQTAKINYNEFIKKLGL